MHNAEPVEAATPIPDTVSEQHADPKDVHPIEESAPAATDEAQPKERFGDKRSSRR